MDVGKHYSPQRERLALIITHFHTLAHLRYRPRIMQTADLNLHVWFMVTDISYDLWWCKSVLARQEMKHNWEIDFTVCFLVCFLASYHGMGLCKEKHNGLDAGILLGIIWLLLEEKPQFYIFLSSLGGKTSRAFPVLVFVKSLCTYVPSENILKTVFVFLSNNKLSYWYFLWYPSYYKMITYGTKLICAFLSFWLTFTMNSWITEFIWWFKH